MSETAEVRPDGWACEREFDSDREEKFSTWRRGEEISQYANEDWGRRAPSGIL